jgi:hypothetical protein
MSLKCVHKGCGKLFSDPADPPCVYHPGGPIFHEGQKGWRCCKPRVLTFDEFLSIPPCTTGQHSEKEEAPSHTPAKPVEEEKKLEEEEKPLPRMPMRERATPSPAPVQAESKKEEEVVDDDDEDDLTKEVKTGTICRRRGCGKSYDGNKRVDKEEECVYHPGHPIFHEGSKGWTCCKRRVLEFDEFMKIEGCNTKPRHVFLESSKDAEKRKAEEASQNLDSIRSDFYQTGNSVIVSYYLKKIDAAKSSVKFSGPETIDFDLTTSDGKHYVASVPLYGETVPAENKFKVMGTKLELTLKKADSEGWPVLRKTDQHTGQIIQSGNAGMAI